MSPQGIDKWTELGLVHMVMHRLEYANRLPFAENVSVNRLFSRNGIGICGN